MKVGKRGIKRGEKVWKLNKPGIPPFDPALVSPPVRLVAFHASVIDRWEGFPKRIC